MIKSEKSDRGSKNKPSISSTTTTLHAHREGQEDLDESFVGRHSHYFQNK